MAVYESIVCVVMLEEVLTVKTLLVLLLAPNPVQTRLPVQPLAVKLAGLPAQTVVLLTCTVAGGAVLTVIEAVVKHCGPVVQVAE